MGGASLSLPPGCTLDDIIGGLDVASGPVATLDLSGTYQALATINLVVTDITGIKVDKTLNLDNSGTWTYELDLSSIAVGEVTVEIKGTNSAQQTVTKQRKFNAT